MGRILETVRLTFNSILPMGKDIEGQNLSRITMAQALYLSLSS